ncbi:MAG: DUF4038 domain-containing protein [Chloroflexota bacterium]
MPLKLPITVQANKRCFTDAEGKPVFWLGDTAWPLFSLYTRDEAETYLARRAEQGFNVVKGVLAWPLGTMYEQAVPQPNYMGELPWLDNNPATPNGAYFEHVEHLLTFAADHDLNLNMLPIWGYHVNDIHLFTVETAHSYGLWLGKRFKDFQNVIWSLGGDRNPTGYEEIYRAMAYGLREGHGGTQLMTFHPSGGSSSARFFHNDDWLNFNLIQTWGDLSRVYTTVITDVLRTPIKPAVLDEGAYEAGPEYPLGPITPLLARRQAWWSLMAGGYYTYGHNDTWRVDPGWIASLDAPGAAQMGVFKAIATSRPWWEMTPCPCLFAEGAGSGLTLNAAMRTQDCRCALIYLSSPCYALVSVGEIATLQVRATWVNPQNGDQQDVGVFKRGNHWFRTPDFWEDAVLILDAVE